MRAVAVLCPPVHEPLDGEIVIFSQVEVLTERRCRLIGCRSAVSFRALESDFADQQTSMHMVMDMMESCVDGKEARDMMEGLTERIEAAEAALEALVAETVASLTAHVDEKVNESVKITKASIDGIESLEARMDRTDAETETVLQQLQQDTDAQVPSVRAAPTPAPRPTDRRNAPPAPSGAQAEELREGLLKACEDVERRLSDEISRGAEEAKLTTHTLEEQLLRRLEVAQEGLQASISQVRRQLWDRRVPACSRGHVLFTPAHAPRPTDRNAVRRPWWCAGGRAARTVVRGDRGAAGAGHGRCGSAC